MARIDTLLRELGVTDPDKALTRISNIVGHPVASRTELTVAEVERVIDVLNAVPWQARPYAHLVEKMSRPRLLDLFCCEGGASEGYRRAGFDVYGVDLFRHRGPDGKLRGYRRERYPFPAVQGDCLDVMRHLLDGGELDFILGHITLRLTDFAVIAASPPCQAYSISKNAHKSSHPELIEPTRDLLVASGLPYVMENVEGAKRQMLSPLTLCGTEFGLRATDSDGLVVWLKRHRLFESNVALMGAGGCQHPKDLLCAGVYGNGSPSRDAAKARAGGYTPPSQQVRADLMGIDWMSRNGLSQSIPPAYTEHIGMQLLDALAVAA